MRVRRSWRYRGVGLAFFVFVTVGPALAAAEATVQSVADPALHRVVVLAQLDPSMPGIEPGEQLREAIAAHLITYRIEVQVVLADDAATLMQGIGLAQTEDALSIAWFDESDETLSILTSSLSDRPSRHRVPDTGEGWPARCEMIAAMVNSALSPLLRGALDDPPVTPAAHPLEQADTALEAEVGNASSGRSKFLFILSAGYLPIKLANDVPVLHGVCLTFGVLLGRHLEIGVGGDFVQGVSLQVPGGKATLSRWPVRFSATGWLLLGPVEIGLQIGAVVEIARVRNLPYVPVDASSTSVHTTAGVAPALTLRSGVLPWLAPFIDIGGDFYFQRHTYLSDGVPLLEPYPNAPRLAVGVAGLFPVRRTAHSGE